MGRAAGNWYMFDDSWLFCKVTALRPIQFLIINHGEHDYINGLAVAEFRAVELTTAAPVQMPRLIARMDASIFFMKPVFQAGIMATKLAELLGCGVPILGNAGVGDMARCWKETVEWLSGLTQQVC